jgi:hypothetical protein
MEREPEHFSTKIRVQPSWPVSSTLVEDVVITRALCEKGRHLFLRFSQQPPFTRLPVQDKRKAVRPPTFVAIDKNDMVQ